MEADDDLSRRPESPKKKVKSNPSGDSEAQPSDYSKSSSNAKHCDQTDDYSGMNGLGRFAAPTRKYKKPVAKSSIPDSSSEKTTTATVSENVSEVIQEGEVSSSENSVSQTGRGTYDVFAVGNADSISNTPDDLTVICDSASSEANGRR